jgi:hypothetical protein
MKLPGRVPAYSGVQNKTALAAEIRSCSATTDGSVVRRHLPGESSEIEPNPGLESGQSARRPIRVLLISSRRSSIVIESPEMARTCR